MFHRFRGGMMDRRRAVGDRKIYVIILHPNVHPYPVTTIILSRYVFERVFNEGDQHKRSDGEIARIAFVDMHLQVDGVVILPQSLQLNKVFYVGKFPTERY